MYLSHNDEHLLAGGPKGAIRRKGALNSVAVRRLPRCLQCFPSSAAAARLRNRAEPNRALGARTQCRRAAQLLHRVLFSSRLAEELRGEVTNKSVPLNQERCVCECVFTPLISQSVHVFIPYCPPPPLQNRGLSPVTVCIGELPTPPCLILTSHPPPHSNSWRGSHGAIQLPLPSCCASCRASQRHGHRGWMSGGKKRDDRS